MNNRNSMAYNEAELMGSANPLYYNNNPYSPSPGTQQHPQQYYQGYTDVSNPYSLQLRNQQGNQYAQPNQPYLAGGYPPVYQQNSPSYNDWGNLPPGYIQAPPNPPTVTYVIKTEGSAGRCQLCGKQASCFNRKRAGCAVWSWAAGLLLCTWVCCWIPFVMNGCYDQELVCSNCLGVRVRIPSKYGC